MGSSRVLSALQRFALRTERGRLRPLWRLAYWFAARAYAALLRGRNPGVSVYLRAARAPAYGLSDIDLAVITPDPAPVLERRSRLRRLLPTLCDVILDAPLVLSDSDLAHLASAPLSSVPLYSASPQRIRVAEKPGLYGPTAGWRLLLGTDRVATELHREAQERRVAAWLELQTRWRWFLQGVDRGTSGPGWNDLCVKAVAEPARIWIWLAHGERTDGRRGTLRRALDLMPDEEPALRAALALDASLATGEAGEEFAGHFVRLSARVASLLSAQLDSAGTTPVRLVGGELVVPPKSTFRLAPIVRDHASTPLLPLADWRALVGASLCHRDTPPATPPDEALAPLALDPGSLHDLTAAVSCGHGGPYPALRGGQVLLLASPGWPRTQLRAAQCRLTDPVSFALLEGGSVADFPDAAGWSAVGWARRAVAEHAPRLQTADLGLAITAARAGLFLDSVLEDAPELSLTASATLARLRELGGATAVDEAEEAYRRFRSLDEPPAGATVAALRDLVAELPAYRRSPEAVRVADAGTRGT